MHGCDQERAEKAETSEQTHAMWHSEMGVKSKGRDTSTEDLVPHTNRLE